MCVAVLIETQTGVSEDDVRKMASANPHGGGVAWCDGNLIHYRKGLTADDVIKLLPVLPRPFLMHFRIATRGGQKPELTHPFPIGYDAITKIDDLTGSARGVLIHNGTWNDFHKYIPIGVKYSDVSDTQIAAYVAGFDESILEHVSWSNALMTAAGGGRVNVTLRGQWTEIDGNYFSNTHWQRERLGGGSFMSFDDWMDWRGGRGYVGGRSVVAPKGTDYTKAPSDDSRKSKLDRKEAKKARRAQKLAAKRAAVADRDMHLALAAGETVIEIDPEDTERVLDLVDVIEATGADVRDSDTAEFLDRDWAAIDAEIRKQGIKI